MTNLLKYDNLWDIILNKELEFIISSRSVQVNIKETTTFTSASVTAEKKYQILLKKRLNDIKKWNRSNDKACSLIMLTSETDSRNHIQKLNNANKMWNILKKIYQRSNRIIKHNALKLMTQTRQMNYSSLEEYADAIKEAFVKRAQINYSLLNEALVDFFLMRLNEDLRFYIFNLIIISNNNKVDWDINTLLSVLNNTETLQKSQKKFKILATKSKRNSSKFSTNKNRKFKKNKKKKQNKNFTCEHCKIKSHTDKKCYFQHSKLRSKNWQSREKNKKYMKENIIKSNFNKNSIIKIIRLMKMIINKMSSSQINHNWCIDSEIENHICHNWALFEIY